MYRIRINTLKSISVVIIVAVLLLFAAPTISAACMDCMCCSVETGNSSQCQETDLNSQCCCVVEDCLIADCSVYNPDDDKVLPTSLFTPNRNTCVTLPQMSVSFENLSHTTKQPGEHYFPEFPSYLYTQYHCRNSLNSEEPLPA